MQTLPIIHIEDCLEFLAGIKGNLGWKPDSDDAAIIHSMAKQVSKGTALTDRQYNLIRSKLEKYKDRFTESGVESIDAVLDRTAMPLRDIDRSRYVRIVNSADEELRITSLPEKLIKVRFPFNKKTIAKLYEVIKVIDDKTYCHKQGSHSHYFYVNETNIRLVLDVFLDKDFEIDPDLKSAYDAIKTIYNAPQEYLPGIYQGELINVRPDLHKNIMLETKGDLIKIIDRRRRYALENIDYKIDLDSVAKKIAFRDRLYFSSTSKIEYSQQQLLEALYELDRFPLLVVIENNEAETQLFDIYNILKNLVPDEQQSVLFRMPGDSAVNTFVAEKKLNNWVDENIKVVYIKQDKFPKVLLKTNWKPIATYSEGCYTFNSFNSGTAYAKTHCDLIVFREYSQWLQHSLRLD